MKLQSVVLPQFHQVLTQGRWFTPSVIVLFLGLEMFGRQATTDVHDMVGVIVLLLILAGIAVRHRANPIPWVKKLGAGVWAVARLGDRLKVDIGPDLRGTPFIRRGLPLAVHLVFALLTVWVVVAALIGYASADGWRPYVVLVTYTGYLATMCLLWGLLFVALLGGVYFPIMLLTRLAGGRKPGAKGFSRGQLWFLGSYFAVTATAAWALPLWPMLAFAWAFWFAVTLLNILPDRPGQLQLIWRNPKSRRVRSIPMRRLLWAVVTASVLLLTALILTAAGGRVFEYPEELTKMPLTSGLGNLLGWFLPGLLLSAAIFVYLAWRNDPAQPGTPCLNVTDVPEEIRKPIATLVRERGWNVTFGEAGANDVRVRLVAPNQSTATEFDPDWPLAVCVDDLAGPMVYSRLERRDEIQLRRHLLRGIDRLFREAKSRPKRGGCGYWLAPHLWFVAGLARDEVARGDEEPTFLTEVVGPPFAEVFTLPVRRYAHQMLKALQVDLIFVEDGVGYRRLSRVLRVLFEVYDKGAGRKRGEDIHFRGLTKVRVMFHEFDVDEPFRSGIYPEPKFAPLGRLRVLHVFRDRGEEEELVEPPFQSDETPAPYLVGV